jgi:PP-loop superfamily ATP-utilizing enzyme
MTIHLQAIQKLKSIGFKYVTVDLQGFRSGAMNEMLPKDDKS